MAKQFTDSNFEAEVLKSDLPVIVDEIANEYDGKVSVGKMNVDENPEIPSKYGIRSIPTLLVFKNGELVEKIVGAVPKSSITSKIETHMA
jgi:thioredoxin 1